MSSVLCRIYKLSHDNYLYTVDFRLLLFTKFSIISERIKGDFVENAGSGCRFGLKTPKTIVLRKHLSEYNSACFWASSKF